MLAALGATPVAMPLPALSDALSKGVVDGYLLPWEVIPSIKAHELTKYESETDPKARALYTAVFVLAMNQAKYDSLPPDMKKVIDDNSGAALSRTFGKGWDASAPPALAGRGSRQYLYLIPPPSWRTAEGHGEPPGRVGQGRDGQGQRRQALLQAART
jgi:hypothetical protein